MKKIKITDCRKLQDEICEYAKTAEQHELVYLLFLYSNIERTIYEFIEKQEVDQEEARTMFRVVYRSIGKDYTEYMEEEHERNDKHP